MASHIGMGQVRFLRAFKISFAATPHQYLMRRRLDRACELLRDSDAPLAGIALETGFSSHAHFSAVFSVAKGVSPSVFRRLRGHIGDTTH